MSEDSERDAQRRWRCRPRSQAYADTVYLGRPFKDWVEDVGDPFPVEREAEVRAELLEILDLDEDDAQAETVLAEVVWNLKLHQVLVEHMGPLPWKTWCRETKDMARRARALREGIESLTPQLRACLLIDRAEPLVLPALKSLEFKATEFIEAHKGDDGRSRPTNDSLWATANALCDVFLAAGGLKVVERFEAEDGKRYSAANLAREFVKTALEASGVGFSENELSLHIGGYIKRARSLYDDCDLD